MQSKPQALQLPELLDVDLVRELLRVFEEICANGMEPDHSCHIFRRALESLSFDRRPLTHVGMLPTHEGWRRLAALRSSRNCYRHSYIHSYIYIYLVPVRLPFPGRPPDFWLFRTLRRDSSSHADYVYIGEPMHAEAQTGDGTQAWGLCAAAEAQAGAQGRGRDACLRDADGSRSALNQNGYGTIDKPMIYCNPCSFINKA